MKSIRRLPCEYKISAWLICKKRTILVENDDFKPYWLTHKSCCDTIEHMDFIGIIADIVASRAETARGQVQKKLVKVLNAINRERSEVLASPYTVTLGDEFQALYRTPVGLFGDLWRISAALHPVRVRYSVALGGLSTSLNREQAIGMDGPVFHIARDGLEQAKKLRAVFRVGGAFENIELINDALMLISHSARDWNSNRLAIEADLSAGKPVKEISKRVGISESAVYKNIKAAALNTVTAITRDIELILGRARGQDQ